MISGPPSAQKQAVARDDADMDAYRRFRKDGLQPRSIGGSAALEKAAHAPFEIESGTLARNKKLAEQMQKVSDLAKNPEAFVPIGEAT